MLKDDIISRILDQLVLKTMEGEVKWSSTNTLDISWEIEDKEHLIMILVRQLEEQQQKLNNEIRFMALKGYEEERILQATGARRRNISQLKKRKSFAFKTKKRLTKRLKTFDLSLSTSWYVEFSIGDHRPFHNTVTRTVYRFMISKLELSNQSIIYAAGCDNCRALHEKPFPNLSSDDLPVLYTLGILLKKIHRVNSMPEQIYSLT